MRYSELVGSGYMARNDLNCAETMLNAANEAYDLGLDASALRVACAFGGGMGAEKTCGALTGGLMVLGCRLATDRSHQDDRMTAIRDEFVAAFQSRFGTTECAFIKQTHRDPVNGCQPVVAGAAELIDGILDRRA